MGGWVYDLCVNGYAFGGEKSRSHTIQFSATTCNFFMFFVFRDEHTKIFRVVMTYFSLGNNGSKGSPISTEEGRKPTCSVLSR